MMPANPFGACGTLLKATRGATSTIRLASITYRSLPMLKRRKSIGSFGEFEPRYTRLEALGRAVELIDSVIGLTQGLGCLLCRFAQLRQSLADLLRARGLGVHPFVDGLEARGQRLHLVNDLSQMSAHLADFLDAAAHFFGELIHPHDAG